MRIFFKTTGANTLLYDNEFSYKKIQRSIMNRLIKNLYTDIENKTSAQTTIHRKPNICLIYRVIEIPQTVDVSESVTHSDTAKQA